MKKFLCVVMSVVMFALMSSVNAFAIQEDVYKAYANELNWLNKTSSVEEYCVYDMNKDGIKELIVKTGTCEADYVYRFYSCEYGKIITLGTFSGGSAGLYIRGGAVQYRRSLRVEKPYGSPCLARSE